ncbi:MAG TPA: hypothetical protein PK867_15915 [Pirellulales bacterium]|nr:hypothetical protein [Pirellulales bacterium]
MPDERSTFDPPGSFEDRAPSDYPVYGRMLPGRTRSCAMSGSPPKCQTATVFAFSGDRTASFAHKLFASLQDARSGGGPGPSVLDCLLFLGHAGVSLDGGAMIWGFNPETAGIAIWQAMERLRQGEAFVGSVTDDTQVFAAARNRGLAILSCPITLPEPQFLDFERKLDLERSKSDYSYGFPNGDGDCNCITWLERLGLPLLTGRMDEFASLPGIRSSAHRRFGFCI